MEVQRYVGPFVFPAIVLMVAVDLANATQYFVDPAGNNATAGSSASPWRTLQYAADRVGPGDRVTVRSGNYAGFYLDTSGTAAAPIEFFAEPGVLVNQPNPIRPDHGINLENASHVIIDGFAVTGMSRAGVRSVGVDGDEFASHVTIRNVHSYNNGYWGILTGFVDDLVIENNETSGSTIEHGIYVSNSGDRPIIRNNISWGNARNGIHINGDAEQGGDGLISNALITSNIIYDNGLEGGSGINMDGVQNSRIENNLLYNNHASGISLYRIDGGGGSTGNTVVNNTIHQAGGNARWALNIQDGSTGNTAYNNMLLSEHATRGAIDISTDSLPNFKSDYNVVISRFTTGGPFVSLAEWRTQTGQDLHSLIAEPEELFENWQGGDYELLATALARDMGTSTLAPLVDLIGNSRPMGARIDVGAYEFGTASLSGDFNANGTVNAADFVVWRKNSGGIFTQNDYNFWRAHFGQTTGNGAGATTNAAVPEPANLTLMILATVGWFLWRRQTQ